MKDSALLPTVLLFGGDASEQAQMARALGSRFECLLAETADAAFLLMSQNFVQVLVVIGDPTMDAFIEDLHLQWPETMVVGVGEPDHMPEDVHAIVPRDWTEALVAHAVKGAAATFRLSRENERLALEMRCLAGTRIQRGPKPDLGFEGVLRSPNSAMAKVVSLARQYASFDVPVLLLGEAGTGKTNLAQAIHGSSMRSDGPFQSLDLKGLSQDAIAGALFGRRPRGQSGQPNKIGLVRKANHGTLYLSGIETLSRPLQSRILRLVQDGTFESEGDPEHETSNARLIVATSVSTQHLLDDGLLDPVLFYALSVAELTVPALRMRKADIAMHARAILEVASRSYGKRIHDISDDALAFLTNYDWPGNLHELENEIIRMLILSQEPVLGAEVVSRHILQAAPCQSDTPADAIVMTGAGTLKDRVEEIEARILRETLTRLSWNKSRSACELGLSRVGLRSKLDRYGITQPHPQTEEA